jgi:hypothetical protein
MSVLIQQGSHFPSSSSQHGVHSISKNDEPIASSLAGLNNAASTSSAKRNTYSESTSLGYNHSVTMTQKRKRDSGVIEKILSNVVHINAL